MFYLAGTYITAMIALLIGSLLTFGMAGLSLTAGVLLITTVVSAAVMFVISEFRDIAAHPDEHNPYSKKGKSKSGWSGLA